MSITPTMAYRLRSERGLTLPVGADYTRPELESLAAALSQHEYEIRVIDQRIAELAVQFPETDYPRRRYLCPDECFPAGPCYFWDEETCSTCEVSSMAAGRRVAGLPNTYYIIETGPASEKTA